MTPFSTDALFDLNVLPSIEFYFLLLKSTYTAPPKSALFSSKLESVIENE